MDSYTVEYMDEAPYIAIVVLLDYREPYEVLDPDTFNIGDNLRGKILLDTLLHSGNTSSRFIELEYDKGHLDFKQLKSVKLDRKDDLRVRTNKVLSQHPDVIEKSILNSAQKKLILRGLSI